MTIKDDGPDPIDVHVGQRLRMRRIQRNLSQSALADAIDVSFQQVQKFENASNRISAARLHKLANALEVPVTYFFEGLQQASAEQGPAQDLMNRPQAAELLKLFFGMACGQSRRAVLVMMRNMPRSDTPELPQTPRSRGRPIFFGKVSR